MSIKKTKTKIILIIAIMASIMLAVIFIPLIILKIRTDAIYDDYAHVFQDEKYSEPVYVEGVEVFKQDVSCGYAVLEMFGNWSGHDITEDKLMSEYGKVVTSTGKNFCAEMNKQFPEYETVMHKYMTNSELIDAVYESLDNGIPVPFEWAALYGDEWTLHYSLVCGMDIPNDKVYIANPYGYNEEISIEEFLDRTSYEAYEDMPWFLKMGFAYGVFEKNTVFIASN